MKAFRIILRIIGALMIFGGLRYLPEYIKHFQDFSSTSAMILNFAISASYLLTGCSLLMLKSWSRYAFGLTLTITIAIAGYNQYFYDISLSAQNYGRILAFSVVLILISIWNKKVFKSNHKK